MNCEDAKQVVLAQVSRAITTTTNLLGALKPPKMPIVCYALWHRFFQKEGSDMHVRMPECPCFIHVLELPSGCFMSGGIFDAKKLVLGINVFVGTIV